MGRENKNTVPISDKIALSPAEVAALTGICETIIRREIKAGELPAKRLGRNIYVLRKEIEAYVEKMENFEVENDAA